MFYANPSTFTRPLPDPGQELMLVDYSGRVKWQKTD